MHGLLNLGCTIASMPLGSYDFGLFVSGLQAHMLRNRKAHVKFRPHLLGESSSGSAMCATLKVAIAQSPQDITLKSLFESACIRLVNLLTFAACCHLLSSSRPLGLRD